MTIDSKISNLTWVIAAVLASVIFLEWAAAKFAENRLLASIESPKPANFALEKIPALELGKKGEESYADLVSRPLFIKGRKPVVDSAVEKDKEAVGSETFDWRLDGIYTGKNGLTALLSRSKEQAVTPVVRRASPTAKTSDVTEKKSDKFRRIGLNDDLDGWRLTQIKADRAVFELDNEIKELVLRKPKPKEPPPEQTNTKANQPHGGRSRRLNRLGAQGQNQQQDELTRAVQGLPTRGGLEPESTIESGEDDSENGATNDE